MNDYQLKALETWYPPEHSLYRDLEHPLFGLVGEAGEIVDQWKKHRFKPGYECSRGEFLDELGDLWYYLRILAWIMEVKLESQIFLKNNGTVDILSNLIYWSSTLLLTRYTSQNQEGYLNRTYTCLLDRLVELDCTLDELTEFNYRKLKGRHGW